MANPNDLSTEALRDTDLTKQLLSAMSSLVTMLKDRDTTIQSVQADLAKMPQILAQLKANNDERQNLLDALKPILPAA